jgi:hypothetical protein
MQFCVDIPSGKLGRAEAQRTYRISANLLQLWLVVKSMVPNPDAKE